MQLTDTFRIARPLDEAWTLVHDPARLAPCVPGAHLTEVRGDEYHGIVSLRLGVLAARFEGSATFDYDDERNRVSVQAIGRGSSSDAEAHITAGLEPISDRVTQVNVDTELQIGGRFASLSGGVITEVSRTLTAQFADNLAASIDVEAALGADVFEPQGGRRVEMPEPEALDLLDAARRPIMKRAVPLALVVLIGWPALSRWRRGRSAARLR